MAQLMPLPLTVSCFRKIRIGYTFVVPAHPGSPGKRAVKRVCVYVYHTRMLCCQDDAAYRRLRVLIVRILNERWRRRRRRLRRSTSMPQMMITTTTAEQTDLPTAATTLGMTTATTTDVTNSVYSLLTLTLNW